MEITLELSCEKWPKSADLDAYWADNRDSLVTYIQQVHRCAVSLQVSTFSCSLISGVRGRVLDASSGIAIKAQIVVKDRKFNISSHAETGKYFRLLMPGTYTLTATAPGYRPLSLNAVVHADVPTDLDFLLEHEGKPPKVEPTPSPLSRLTPRPSPPSPSASTPPSPRARFVLLHSPLIPLAEPPTEAPSPASQLPHNAGPQAASQASILTGLIAVLALAALIVAAVVLYRYRSGRRALVL